MGETHGGPMDKEPDDGPKAESKEDAVAVSQYGNGQAVALGNEERDEWIIAPNAYELEDMR